MVVDGAADKAVADILPLEEGDEAEAVGKGRRHVLGGMDRQIDSAFDQRLLDLLGEKALAAGLRQRPVLDGVAAGLDDLHGDVAFADAMGPGEQAAHLMGLGEGEGRTAGADAEEGRLRHGNVR